jgi:Zn-dependent peptidase ImmA (M78 family)
VTPEQQGQEAAADFRREHHLENQPLGDLAALIEQTTGIDVAVLDVGPDEHGLAMRDAERDVTFIAVARTRNPMRQRSSLAHELAHVLFEDWVEGEARDYSARTPDEQRADAFARHLLVPTDGLAAFLGARDAVTEADLSAVVQRFLISPAIAAIALHGGGYIDTATKCEWMKLVTPRLATRFGWTDQYQTLQNDSDRPRAPRRLLARAIAGYQEGVVSAQTVATLRGVSAETVTEELAEAGITPQEPATPWLLARDLPSVVVDLSDLESDNAADERQAHEDNT